MPHKTPPESDWINALSDFLASQSGVEAIRLNAEERSVQVATLGQVDIGALQSQINELLRTLDDKLLALPIDAHAEGLQLTRKEGELLLQKPTCPTAPRFWKWRDFEWPEAEEIEKQSDEEWRAMAVQAAICGVMLVPPQKTPLMPRLGREIFSASASSSRGVVKRQVIPRCLMISAP